MLLRTAKGLRRASLPLKCAARPNDRVYTTRYPARNSSSDAALLSRLVHASRKHEERVAVAEAHRDQVHGQIPSKQKNFDENEAYENAKATLRWLKEEARLQDKRHRKLREDDVPPPSLSERVEALVARHVDHHEPLAYIIGDQPFGPLTIKCRSPVLIPRPETEFMTEDLAKDMRSDIVHWWKRVDEHNAGQPRRQRFRILDLCTGTGCIALLLRHRLNEALGDLSTAKTFRANEERSLAISITAADISSDALSLTKDNAVSTRQPGEGRDRDQVPLSIRAVDMLDDVSMASLLSDDNPIDGDTQSSALFDCVICNPPYISAKDWAMLDPSVRDWEDRRALVSSAASSTTDKEAEDGLLYYWRLAKLLASNRLVAPPTRDTLGGSEAVTSKRHYRHTPSLAVEIDGMDQAAQVSKLFRDALPASAQVQLYTDPFGRERGVFVWLAAE